MLGQLALVFAAGLAVLLAIAWKFGTSMRGAAACAALLLGGLLLNGFFYAELPAASAILLAAAPAIGVVRLGTWRPGVVRICLALLVAAAAFTLALRASPPLEYGY